MTITKNSGDFAGDGHYAVVMVTIEVVNLCRESLPRRNMIQGSDNNWAVMVTKMHYFGCVFPRTALQDV